MSTAPGLQWGVAAGDPLVQRWWSVTTWVAMVWRTVAGNMVYRSAIVGAFALLNLIIFDEKGGMPKRFNIMAHRGCTTKIAWAIIWVKRTAEIESWAIVRLTFRRRWTLAQDLDVAENFVE